LEKGEYFNEEFKRPSSLNRGGEKARDAYSGGGKTEQGKTAYGKNISIATLNPPERKKGKNTKAIL